MSLNKTITLWNDAVVLCQRGECEESIKTFQKIDPQSAKFCYNIGCVYMFLARYAEAIKSFDAATSQDQFLAIGYFQRAVAKFYLHQYADAGEDFLLTRSSLRGEAFIDYQQLGLPFTLYLYQILHNLAVVQLKLGNESAAHDLIQESIRLQSEDGSKPASYSSNMNGLQLIEVPQNKCLFCPSKSLVKNLVKRDFLGKARVVSSVIENDTFVGFEGNRKIHSAPGSPVLSRPLASRPRTPVIPSRPPPKLPDHTHSKESTESQKEGTTSRPPPPNRVVPQLCAISRPPPPNRVVPQLCAISRPPPPNRVVPQLCAISRPPPPN